MAHDFNLSTREADASLFYRVSSRTASIATEKLCFKIPKQQQQQQNLKKNEKKLMGQGGGSLDECLSCRREALSVLPSTLVETVHGSEDHESEDRRLHKT